MPIPDYIPDNVAHVRILGSVGDGDPMGVGFWTPCTETDGAALSTFADDVLNAWASSILADQSAGAQLLSARVLSYVGGHEYTGASTTSASGGTAGDSLPAQVCAVVNWLEIETYRGGHPRTYIWGVPESAFLLANSSLSGAYRTALSSEANDFLTQFNALTLAGGPQLSVLHRVAAGVPLTPGYLNALHSPTVRSKVGSQRRRITV